MAFGHALVRVLWICRPPIWSNRIDFPFCAEFRFGSRGFHPLFWPRFDGRSMRCEVCLARRPAVPALFRFAFRNSVFGGRVPILWPLLTADQWIARCA